MICLLVSFCRIETGNSNIHVIHRARVCFLSQIGAITRVTSVTRRFTTAQRVKYSEGKEKK